MFLKPIGGLGLREDVADQGEIFPRVDQTVNSLIVDLRGRFVELVQLGVHLGVDGVLRFLTNIIIKYGVRRFLNGRKYASAFFDLIDRLGRRRVQIWRACDARCRKILR